MEPLRITAEIVGPISLPDGYVHLDALLAAAVARRDQLMPAHLESELVPIEIPVEREPAGRFHLASASACAVEVSDVRYTQRRFPLAEAQRMTDMRRVNLGAGPQKMFRIPMEAAHLVDDRLDWWCVGDRAEIDLLLRLISHLGKKRSVGLGRVRRWSVEPCESWGDGFPVVTPDGKPTRHLPPDWPGLVEPNLRHGNLTYPYWLQSREGLIAAPCTT